MTAMAEADPDGDGSCELSALRVVDPAASDAPFRLSAAEWAALFPAPPTDADVPDGGAPARAAHPLTERAVLDLLGDPRWRAGPLASLVKFSRFTAPVSAYHRVPHDLVTLPLAGLLWYFAPPTGRFSTLSLAASTASTAVGAVAWSWGIIGYGILALGRRWNVKDVTDGVDDVEKQDIEPTPPPGTESTWDAHVLAPMLRWMILTDGDRASESGPLVRHDPTDTLCPCARASCCGSYPRVDSTLRSVALAVQVLASMVAWVLLKFWIQFITAGTTFWHIPWSAALGGLVREFRFRARHTRAHLMPRTVLVEVILLTSNYVTLFFTQPNAVPARLTSRLQRRAATLALDDLVARCATGLKPDLGGAPGHTPEPPGADEEDARLSAALVSFVRARNLEGEAVRKTLSIFFVSDVFVGGIINAAAAGCIPAVGLASGLVILGFIAQDLAQAAAANAAVAGVADQYRRAASRLRSLLLAAPLASTPEELDTRAKVREHLRALEAFAGEPGLAARFMGFPVSFGALRTLLVTALTVVVGLWGILRGLGVFVAVENACPTVSG